MSWNDVLIEVVNLVFKAVIALMIPYVSSVIGNKIRNDHIRKLVEKGESFVTKSIEMVQQTFVEDLKKQGKFDAESQAIAFKQCYDNWMSMASDEIKCAIMNEVGDLDAWLETMIEAGIAEKKNWSLM